MIAIAAAALGFAPVLALDRDPVAVEVARGNAAANGVALEAVEADIRSGPLPAAALAVANIDADAVCDLGGRLEARRLIASGYRAAERPRLRGFVARSRRELDGWAADVFAAR